MPVCLVSRACVMRGIGEKSLPCPIADSCHALLVNPRLAVATRDVFGHLGLKPGSLRVGIADVLRGIAWPKDDAPGEHG